MTEKMETTISLEALCLLASFTARETLKALQAKDLLSDAETNTILANAVEALNMSTIGLTRAEANVLLNVLMGRPFTTPERNIN